MRDRNYAVVTADIVSSRHVAQFRRNRDRKLLPLSSQHMKEGLIVSEYAVTAWDEFQAILKKIEYLPQVVFDLRRKFQPMNLWIAIGIGHVSEPYKKPVNVFSGGAAFELAREAADDLKRRGAKDGVFTQIRSGLESFDVVANTLYHLHDALLQTVTAKQWETINRYVETQHQGSTAKKLGLDVSTVSRNLKRGHYWAMQEAKSALITMINNVF